MKISQAEVNRIRSSEPIYRLYERHTDIDWWPAITPDWPRGHYVWPLDLTAATKPLDSLLAIIASVLLTSHDSLYRQNPTTITLCTGSRQN